MPPKASKKALKPSVRWLFLGAAVVFVFWGGYNVSQLKNAHAATSVNLSSDTSESDSAGSSTRASTGRKLGARGSLHRYGATALDSSPCKQAKAKTSVVYRYAGDNPRAYHLVTTAQGFANHWQVRKGGHGCDCCVGTDE